MMLITIIGNVVGLLLIGFVVWWFWMGKRSKAAVIAGSDVVEIIVEDGVYKPDAIKVKVGQPITLRFLRKDESPCSKVVLFSDFNQSAELPVGEPYDITLTPDKPGEFEFTCQMAMYRGRLIVD